MERINENINRLTIPYKDIFTTIYTIKVNDKYLLFDTGSFDEDVDKYIIPFLDELGINGANLKYVFISHNHQDHSGGLLKLVKNYPDVSIISMYPPIKEKYKNNSVILPKDGETILDVLKVITIPGHSDDSIGILDTRTNTLITGDCLQLYGIFGSGKWGANISLLKDHMIAINKLKSMKIDCILTAHNFHPYGYRYEGMQAVKDALDKCIEPFIIIKGLIDDYPELDDTSICEMYNSKKLPTLGEGIVTVVRQYFN